MPPVFGPGSPSPTRLKSWAGRSGTTVAPSVSANSETSGRPGTPRRRPAAGTRGLRGGRGRGRRSRRLPCRRRAVVLHHVGRRRTRPARRRPRPLRADARHRGRHARRRPSRPSRTPCCPRSGRPPRSGRSTRCRAPDGVRGARDQRRLRPDHDQVGAQPGGQVGDGCRSRRRRGGAAPPGMPALPGATTTAATAGSACSARKRVLAGAGTDDEDLSRRPTLVGRFSAPVRDFVQTLQVDLDGPGGARRPSRAVRRACGPGRRSAVRSTRVCPSSTRVQPQLSDVTRALQRAPGDPVLGRVRHDADGDGAPAPTLGEREPVPLEPRSARRPRSRT